MSQAQIGQELRFVNWEKAFYRLDLYNDLIFDDEIKPISTVELHFFINDWQRPLFVDIQAELSQLIRQARLIGRFQ